MRRLISIAILPVLVSSCQGAGPGPARAAPSAGFSNPNRLEDAGVKPATLIFASDGEVGNVDVYSAKSFKMISQCPCTGVGLAVDPKSGNLAVGTTSSTVTVWRVTSKQITLFATLHLSQGPDAIGLAFDQKGDLYAGNAGDNVIDFFDATEIAGGGGAPTRTLVTSHLNEVEYLAADARSLLADGYDSNGQPLVVSVNTRTGADTVLHAIPSGTLPEGIVFDRNDNLVVNTIGNTNTLAVYKKPWTGTPASTLVYGSGADNGYYTGISLDKSQHTLWAGSFMLPNPSHGFGSIQANSYPLKKIGRSSTGIESEFYDSVAVDPQAK
jgi:DNA-binding beta-propeller fold protein YncE